MDERSQQQICLSCMACCKVLHIPTLFKPTDYMIFFYETRGHTVLVADGVMYIEIDEECPMLTAFGCKIYDARPYTCRVSFGWQSPIERVRLACKLKGGDTDGV